MDQRAEQPGGAAEASPGGFPADDFEQFGRELDAARARLAAAYAALVTRASLPAEEVTRKLVTQELLVELPPALPPELPLTEIALELLRIGGESEVIPEAELRAARTALDHSRLDLPALVRDMVSQDSEALQHTAQTSGVAEDTLCFVAEQLARPILEHLAGAAGTLPDEGALKTGTCPACGNRPVFAILEGEEGNRYLVCGICATKWRYKRIGCPFCGNQEQKSLRYFTVEDEADARVEVCDECKGFLKQFDNRKRTRTVEELRKSNRVCARLDILAMREGYR
jgi:FdhE protein